MGSALSAHLIEQGFVVHGFDEFIPAREKARQNGVTVYDTLTEAVQASKIKQKTIWLMVPASVVDEIIIQLEPLLEPEDCIIDGGNSFFKESIRRQESLEHSKIHFIDCGTSGGVDGARNGASLMVGGEKSTVETHEDLFTALAVHGGYAHVGGPGAGHFAKMVHNAIEYGMMGAIAEGVNILHEHSTALNLDMQEALKPYEHGSIIQSKLMSWVSHAISDTDHLNHIRGEVPKGETEMEMEYLVHSENVLVLEAALAQRKLTRTTPSFIGSLISAMRNQFGGHAIIEK